MPGLNPPILGVSRIFLHGLTGFGYYSTLIAAVNVWVQSKQGDNTMVFDTEIISRWILIIATILGVVVLVGAKYWYLYEDKRKHSDSSLKWNHVYTVAIFATVICSILASYVIIAYGLDLFIDKPITDVGLAFLICFFVGVISAFVFDSIFPRYIADGTLAKAYADTQELVRKKAEEAAEALKTKEAQEAILNAIREKVKTFAPGLSEKKVEQVANMMKSEDDPNLPLYVLAANQLPEQ